MLPSIAEVLALDAVRRGRPQVLAAADHLDRPVRWVHVSEVEEIAHLLRGGELILTTGIALPDDRARLRRYVSELAAVGAAGLVVELGYKYAETLPDVLISEAERHHLPLVALRRETPFVPVTEQVHARIVDSQLEELRATELVHTTFTALSVEGASVEDVVRRVAKMAGGPVVLENRAHHVLAHDAAGTDPAELLEGWEERSRRVAPEGRTGYDEPAGWLVTTVGARGDDWGRLVLLRDEPPLPRHTVLVEQAAIALALTRLIERDREGLERQAHRAVLSGLLDRSGATGEELAARARALGVPLERRRLIGVVVRLRPADGDPRLSEPDRLRQISENGELAAHAARDTGIDALTGPLDDTSVGVLLALPPRSGVDRAIETFARRLHTSARSANLVVAAGAPVENVADVRHSFLEAQQVAAAAVHQPDRRLCYRLPDVRLRGLLHLLRDDSRLQTFVERELGALLAHDSEHGTDLLGVLTAFCAAGRNKSTAAGTAHLSRPAFYERLRKIEQVLGVDLDSVESCLSLHVALLGLSSLRDRTT